VVFLLVDAFGEDRGLHTDQQLLDSSLTLQPSGYGRLVVSPFQQEISFLEHQQRN